MDNETPLKRRSHLKRSARDRGFRITDKDVDDIFEPLSRHAQLTTRQLVAYGSRNPIITKARLGELWHGTQGQEQHYLHRLNEDILFANHLYVEDMHRLGEAGHQLLVSKGKVSLEPWVLNSRIGGNSTSPNRIIRLAHDHMVSNIMIDIEIGARDAGAEFRSHIDILSRAPEATREHKRPLRIPLRLDDRKTFVEPDALFAIGDRVYALEADRGTETISTAIREKFLAYRELVADRVIDDWLGIDNLTVLIATNSEKRMRNMMDELASIARKGKSVMFGFNSDPSFDQFLQTPRPEGRLICRPWERIGHEALQLI